MRLIQGEEIMLTRNGKDFARLVPVAPKLPKSKQGKKKDKGGEVLFVNGDAAMATFDTPPHTPTPPLEPAVLKVRLTSRCEAPFANCKIEGELYEVEFWSDGEIKKKKVYLCPGHAYKAKQSSESVKKI